MLQYSQKKTITMASGRWGGSKNDTHNTSCWEKRMCVYWWDGAAKVQTKMPVNNVGGKPYLIL